MNAAWQITLPLPPVVTSSIAGVAVADMVFDEVDDKLRVTWCKADGDRVASGGD